MNRYKKFFYFLKFIPRVKSKQVNRISVGIVVLNLLNACSVGPNYVRPSIDIPASYKENTKDWKVAEPRDEINKGEWWQVFKDPMLNKLESQVNITNQTVAVAAAQYQEARALVNVAQASFFPTLSSAVDVTRQKLSTTTRSTATPTITTHRNSELDASWELDLWGKLRRTLEARKAEAQATAAQLANVQLSMQATLAQDYFQLRTIDANQNLLNNIVIQTQKILAITQGSYKNGVGALSDVLQAESQLENARARALDNQIERRQYEHALAVLVGQAPANFTLSANTMTHFIPQIPLQLPSRLLERRPDVAQAERQAAQANAEIGVAMAAFFPDLSLSATGGFSSNFLGTWFTSPARFWTLGTQLAQNVFAGGLHVAQTKAAQANYEAAAANYRQTVLSALQDVEDNLMALTLLEQEFSVQNNAAKQARLSAQLVNAQYKAGATAYINLLTAQTAANNATKSANDIAGRQQIAAVKLIKALGGGWQTNAMK